MSHVIIGMVNSRYRGLLAINSGYGLQNAKADGHRETGHLLTKTSKCDLIMVPNARIIVGILCSSVQLEPHWDLPRVRR